ncbi:hypothetical protein B0J11DRAFT_404979, partial [Dendryphion nanum]
KFLLLMAQLGQPVRIKFVRSLSFSIARPRSAKKQPIKALGKNWPRAFEERHFELQMRRVKSIDLKRHNKNV